MRLNDYFVDTYLLGGVVRVRIVEAYKALAVLGMGAEAIWLALGWNAERTMPRGTPPELVTWYGFGAIIPWEISGTLFWICEALLVLGILSALLLIPIAHYLFIAVLVLQMLLIAGGGVTVDSALLSTLGFLTQVLITILAVMPFASRELRSSMHWQLGDPSFKQSPVAIDPIESRNTDI